MKNLKLLFFSRGRGHGHAVPDIAIAQRLCAIEPNIEVVFSSYATGAATFQAAGLPCIDLQLSERNSILETLVKATRVIESVRPNLVVSHEEFVVGVAANTLGYPSVFVTDWFGRHDHINMRALSFFDEILFIGRRGIFDEPEYLREKISEIGAIVRPFSYKRKDRERARGELMLDHDEYVISVLPGGWATEEKEPISDLVLKAFDLLPNDRKKLLWMAGQDYEAVSRIIGTRKDVVIKPYDPQIDRIMVATDVAIAKANRVTCLELSSLGVPTISLSYGNNRIDDVLVSRIPKNILLNCFYMTSEKLVEHIDMIYRAHRASENAVEVPSVEMNALESVIMRIVKRLNQD